MCNTDEYLPFFPSYKTILYHKDNLMAVWFEKLFSQSYYNYNNDKTPNGSNACTIIAILVAAKVHVNRIKINAPDEFSTEMVYIFGYSMLQGNKIYEMLKSRGILEDVNLTVPEAIKYAGIHAAGLVEWKSLLCLELLSTTLYQNMKKHVMDWMTSSHYKSHPDLYSILITQGRSVLFIIQDSTETVTVIDSHQHSSKKGALIATTELKKLELLCKWFVKMLEKYYQANSKLYELTFLYFEN